jgi:uncharacterized protein YhhL (DUF1145 family)
MSEVENLANTLKTTLNSSALTTDSLYGIIILVLIVWIVIKFAKNVTRSIGSIIGLILVLEVGHILAFQSTVGNDYPILKEIFKYDVLTAIAQLFVGTKFGDFLLSAQAWLIQVMNKVASFINDLLLYGISFFKGV